MVSNYSPLSFGGFLGRSGFPISVGSPPPFRSFLTPGRYFSTRWVRIRTLPWQVAYSDQQRTNLRICFGLVAPAKQVPPHRMFRPRANGRCSSPPFFASFCWPVANFQSDGCAYGRCPGGSPIPTNIVRTFGFSSPFRPPRRKYSRAGCSARGRMGVSPADLD